MELTGSIMITLQNVINNAKHTDIDYIIAEYILKNLHKKDISINEISEESHISKASITRFAQSLGYGGFAEFKNELDFLSIGRDEMKIDLLSLNKSKEKSFTNKTNQLKNEFEYVVQDLTKYTNEIDLDIIEELCDIIYQSNNLHIFSTLIPGNISYALQNMLLTAGKFVTAYPTVQQQFETTKALGKEDLILFISLEGSHVMKRGLTLATTNSEATSILITQNPEMKLGSLFDKIVPLGEHDLERSGKYKLLMFVEYLAHFYFNKYGI